MRGIGEGHRAHATQGCTGGRGQNNTSLLMLEKRSTKREGVISPGVR